MRISHLGAKIARRLGHGASRTALTSAAILAGGMMFAGSASADVLFSEDFEGLELSPFVSRTDGDGTDFTEALPAGWARDNTNTPVPVDAPEYFGFQVFDVDSWIAEAGDQDRSTFTKGGVGAHGNVLVADPDQFDDQTEIDSELFNVFATTPSVSLVDITPGSVAVNFDSSFRPYGAMTGLVDVSFDGGANWTNLLTLDTASTPGGESSLDRANESISLPVDNPGSGEMLIRFGMTTGSNDWWWAVDNVSVTGNPVPEPSTAILGGIAAAGLAALGLRRRK